LFFFLLDELLDIEGLYVREINRFLFGLYGNGSTKKEKRGHQSQPGRRKY